MATILCPHCGTANRTGSNFCNRCGASLRGELGAPDAAPPPPADRGADEIGQAATPADALEGSRAEDPAGGQPGGSSVDQPGEQPWLQRGFSGEDDVPLAEDDDFGEDVDAGIADSTEIPVAAGRLVSGIQGLIEPIRVATVPGEGDGEPLPVPPAVLDVDQLRRVRALMAEDPVLAAGQAAAVNFRVHRSPSLWLPWVFLLIGVVVAVPVFWQLQRPTGTAREWPGVDQAYAAVEALSPQSTVQVLWAYDPATAGELDLLAAPMVRHLLDKGATLQIVSLLPNGPPTARRLLAAVHDERSQLRRGLGEAAIDPPRFLPGGVLALPFLSEERADLAVVFGAEAEDVQGWLEQVAPRNGAPVIAATSAAADPTLRPYLASGQLVGLVSGFDGAAAYTAKLADLPARSREQQFQRQLVGQNLAIPVFLLLILAGNLAILFSGRRGDE
jgi:hypothetical protein